MSDQAAALAISLVVAALIFTIAVVIRIRGPVGLVKGVDWDRVSDPRGFGQFVSLILGIMAIFIAAHGVVLYALNDDRELRNIASVVFVILIVSCTLALIVGQLRYQDRRPLRHDERDGRR